MKTFALYKRGPDAKRLAPEVAGYRERPYYVTWSFRGVAFTRCTETNDATAAQKQARKLREQISASIRAAELAHGRRFTPAELRDALKTGDLFARLDATKLRHAATATFSDIVPLYRQYAAVQPRCKAGNLAALWYVLRHALQQPHTTEADWLRKPLTLLTRRLVLDFQNQIAGPDPKARNPAATNANSWLRQARSVFADRRGNNLLEIYAEAGIKLPDLRGFKHAPLRPEPSHKFIAPSTDMVQRLHDAARDLRGGDPNGYRIYLLSVGCGLRKKEIAQLCGSHVRHDGARHAVFLTNTKTGKDRVYPMEDFVWQELVALDPLLAAPRSADPIAPLHDFILSGDWGERYGAAFRRFGRWLAALGWNRQKKAHELRKLCGSLIDAQHGPDIASRLLGNSREVFEQHYFSFLRLPEVNILGGALVP